MCQNTVLSYFMCNTNLVNDSVSFYIFLYDRQIPYDDRVSINISSKAFDETCFDEVDVRQNDTSTKSLFDEMDQ